jgi:2-iminobutanoate/2-iminopropanoate deaminase
MKLIILSIVLISLFVCGNTADSVERIFPKNVPAAIGPYTPVTVIGTTVFVSGQIAINPMSGNVEADDIVGQTYQVMKNLKAALEGAGCTFSDVAKTTVLLSDMSYFNQFNAIYAEFFEQKKYPARACYAVFMIDKSKGRNPNFQLFDSNK